MSIMMSIDGLRGSSAIAGYEGWLPLQAFDWGGTRVMMHGTGGDRRASSYFNAAPQLRAVKAVRISDQVTPEIWTLMLGSTRKKVEFVWLRTGTEKPVPYMTLKLEDALITSMAEVSASAEPEETITFVYSRVTVTVVNVGSNLTGAQDIVTYDLPNAALT